MRAIVLFLLFLANMQLSAFERKQFLHFDKSNDFPFNSVDHIMQDSYGYLWISSSSGLARYDGYTFEVYSTQDKTNGLPSNRVFFTFETSNRQVLVGTNLGLAVYNRKTNKFKLLSYSCTTQIVEDKQKQVWVTTFDGIDVRNITNLDIKTSFFCENDKNIKIINGITLDSLGRAWSIVANEGIYVFDTKTNKVQKHISSKQIPNIEQIKAIHLVFDRQGAMWIRTAGNGLFCIDTASYKTQRFESNSGDPTSIGSNNVVNIYVDKKGDLWACCQYGYLNRYNRAQNSFERLLPREDNPRFLNVNSIFCINQDKTGNYWIGTAGNGMYCLSEMYNNFQTFISLPSFSSKSNVGQVTSFAELDNGIVVLACDGDGLKFYNPKDNTIRDFENNNQLRSKNMRKIVKHKGYLWGASCGGGMFKIDLKTNQVTNFVYDVNNPKGINFNIIMGLYPDDSAMVIATHGDGLAFYNYKTNTFTHKNNSKAAPFNHEINNWINSVNKDSEGKLWISTCYGLNCFANQKVTHYGTTESEQSINSFDVVSVLEDRRHQIWVLTSSGLDLFNPKTNTFTRMSASFSLPSNTRSLLEDADGNLWLCSANKLIKINAASNNSVQMFDKNDGLVNGDFNTNASFCASNGTLYFGASDGFMTCIPSKIKADNNKPQLCFRNLFVNYVKQTPDSVYLKQTIETSDTLQYKYTEDVISIELSAILFGRSNKINYSYSFDTKKGVWLQLGKDRIISFTALKAGTHILTVKADVENGVSVQKHLVIIVHPKWWMTWWFNALITLLAVAFVLWFIYWRIQKVKSKNIELEKLIAERTKDLHVANQSLSEQSERLQEQNNSLLEKQVVIEMKNSQLEDALDSKDKLIGIVAHDFKNPLTAVHGLSTMLFQDVDTLDASKIRKYAQGILSASESLTTQMISVLDWAQSQVQDLVCRPVEINIETIINDAISLVKESATQKQIAITTQLDYATNALIDPRMISTVLRNLLSNAIKFTPRGGSITVVVQEYDAELEVSIIDSGIGMNQTVVKTLFDKTMNGNTYGTENERGIGLGLRVCKTFVEKNKGSIRVKSIEGEGSVFSVSVPKGKDVAIKTQKLEKPVETVETPQADIEIDKTASILLIDDDVSMLSMLKQMLDPYYTILTASDGNSGLQMARNVVPTLIISDITMPHVSGIELCTILKKDPMSNHIPIVLISSLNDKNTQRQSIISGAEDMIEKPFDKVLLLYKVSMLLKKQKTQIAQRHIETDAKDFKMPASYDDVLMKRTLEYIHANFCEPEFDINEVADNVGLSRTQLWRKFKSTTGHNVSDYVFDLRMRKAKEMLETGKYKIAEIAYSVGFSSPQYFTKCFSQHVGESPKDYADKVKKRTS